MKINRFKDHVRESAMGRTQAQAQPQAQKEATPEQRPTKAGRSMGRKKVVTVPKWVNY